MRVRRVVCAWVVATAAATASAGVDTRRIEAERASVLGDDYQAALPDGRGSAATTGPARTGRSDEQMIDTREQSEDFDAGVLGGIIHLLLWGAAIVGTGILAFWLVSELSQYTGDDAHVARDAAVAPPVDLAVIERPLGDADELARRGEYREAIHTLLLRTLQELVRTTATRVPAALTSREILGRVPLQADARGALADLITAVEVTHFGGEEATVADFDRCRARFQVFAQAFRAQAGAR